MRYLVSGSTATLRQLIPQYGQYLGFLLTPANGNSVQSVLDLGIPWACDNGAFSGFDPVAFRRMLGVVRGQPGLLWVACPDAVGDARRTLELWGEWELEARAAGVPVAFVLQDGQEDYPLPDADAYFVGGSTEFKLSRAAYDLVQEGKCKGGLLHMGRVNSLRRLEVAHSWGCDTVDGSSASRWGDKYIRQYPRWIRQIEEQGALF